MPLIGKAWKANVNVWKRHLTLQSVFNRGECIMHVDKNADGHVVDQNAERILREIAYVPLSGRIRSKGSSCMQLFSGKKWVQDMLTYGRDIMRILNFGHASQRSNGFEFSGVLPRGLWIWNLNVLPRGLMDLWKVIFVPMCMGPLP